jgi:L-threonylcarbamoyladenylate synthase
MKTITIKTDPSSQIDSAIAQAMETLQQGGLVAFPTETVYGLAARADQPASLTRLAQLKQRPVDKPFTLHIGRKSVLDRFVPDLSLLDRQFLNKAWPGPLTVIFQLNQAQQDEVRKSLPDRLIASLYHNNSIGIRLPDHPVACKLLTSSNSPIVAPSANLAGAAPPTCPQDVLEQLNGQIELLLDSGPTRYAGSSTVVKIQGDSMEIVRAGVLDFAVLERMRRVTILCVCTGNTCRSPMAEGIFRFRLAEKLSCPIDQLSEKGYKVMSAGVMAFGGMGATPEAVQASQEMGIDISSHRARLLMADMVNEADFVFIMSSSHYKAVERLSGQAITRTALLAEDEEIDDPVGMSIEAYRQCARHIADGIDRQLEKGLVRWSAEEPS